MAINIERLNQIRKEVAAYKATLVAVSKTKPIPDILEAFSNGQSVFGENYVQELIEKQMQLPPDLNWHFIGHLQGNKVKYLAPFISMIQTVDSWTLLKEINKQAEKMQRTIQCLLQVYIADEKTKFGFSYAACEKLLAEGELMLLKNIRICGLMGMATLTPDEQKIRAEFRTLHAFYLRNSSYFYNNFNNGPVLSMGMTSDYKIALDEGSTMVRIGSALFGSR